jgi:hypothetical protein
MSFTLSDDGIASAGLKDFVHGPIADEFLQELLTDAGIGTRVVGGLRVFRLSKSQ